MAEDRKAGDPAKACPGKKENIIVIGSELQYNSFWLKMMFMSCGIAVGRGSLTPPGWSPADKTTILYSRAGYVRHELLAIESLRDDFGHELVPVTSPATVTRHMSQRQHGGQLYKINRLIFFSHGVPNTIRLEYPETSGDLPFSIFAAVPSDAFCPSGQIISYACNTAYPTGGSSLALRLAAHFGVKVKAFDGLTNYGRCLRLPSQSDQIVETLNDASGGGVINLSDEHEALPHPGLGGWGAWREGTDDYALWRKQAARALPVKDRPTDTGLRDYP